MQEDNSTTTPTSSVADSSSDIQSPDLQPPNKSPVLKIILIILLIILGAGAIFIFTIFLQLNGGRLFTFTPKPPDPISEKMVQKREETKKIVSDSFTELENDKGFSKYALSLHDYCYEGQNNSKVHDGYSHRCTLRETRYYGFNGNFRETLLNFEHVIKEKGWNDSVTRGYGENAIYELNMERIIEHYYDKRNTASDPTKLVSDLPAPDYNDRNKYCTETAEQVYKCESGYQLEERKLWLEYAEKDTKDFFSIEHIQNVWGGLGKFYEKKDFQDIPVLFSQITKDNQYVLVLSVEKDYYRK